VAAGRAPGMGGPGGPTGPAVLAEVSTEEEAAQ